MKKIKRQLSLFLIAPFIVACGGDGGGGGGSFSPSPPNRDNYAPPSPPTGDRSGGGYYNPPTPPAPVVSPDPAPLDPAPNIAVSPPSIPLDPPEKPDTTNNRFNIDTSFLGYDASYDRNINIGMLNLKNYNDNNFGNINRVITKNELKNNKRIAVIDSNFVSSDYSKNRFYVIDDGEKRKSATKESHGSIVLDIISRLNKNSLILGYPAGSVNNIKNLLVSNLHYEHAYKNGARIFNNSYGNIATYDTANQITPALFLGNEGDKIVKDSIFIWAAGNEKNTKQGSPESIYPKFKQNLKSSWISVAAYDGQDSSHLASYSNVIGEDAQTWGITANGTYDINGYHKGTSFATPRVTAVVANIWNKFPWMNNHLVLVTLFSTANKPGSNELTNGSNSKFGWGILNGQRAIKGPAFLSRKLLTEYDRIGTERVNLLSVLKVNIDKNYDDRQVTWSNDISGDAGIYKTGIGKLILSGNNSYSGSTIVNQGTLIVSNSLNNANVYIEDNGKFIAKNLYPRKVEINLLKNGYQIKFWNNGLLGIYGKGLKIDGDYDTYNGGNGKIIIDVDQSELEVTGTADLKNTTIEADVENTSLYKSNVTRSILVAGSILGFNNNNTCQKGSKPYISSFSCSSENNKKINATYSLNNTAQALAKVLNIETLSTNDSQFYENAADLIDLNLDYLAQNNIKSLSASKLLSSNSNEIKQNVEQIAAKIYPENQDYISQKNQILVNNISNKVYKSLDKDSSFYTEILSSNLNSKTKADTKAFLAGFNYKVNSDFSLGFAFSNDNSKLNFLDDSNKKDENEIFANFINLYSAKNFDNFYTSANLNLGIISNRLKRNVIDSVISNNYDTKILNLYTELGKNFKFNNFKFSPYLLANFEKQFLSDFNEKGSDFAIKTKNVNFNNANLGLGFRLDLEFDKLNLSANLRHLRAVNSRNFDFSAKNINDADIKIKGKKMAKYFNFIETDAFYNLNKKISLNFALGSSFEENKNLNNNFKFGLFYKI